MRYIQEKAEEKPPKKPKKEKPPVKAGEKDYDYADLGRRKPMLGGNYNA